MARHSGGSPTPWGKRLDRALAEGLGWVPDGQLLVVDGACRLFMSTVGRGGGIGY